MLDEDIQQKNIGKHEGELGGIPELCNQKHRKLLKKTTAEQHVRDDESVLL